MMNPEKDELAKNEDDENGFSFRKDRAGIPDPDGWNKEFIPVIPFVIEEKL